MIETREHILNTSLMLFLQKSYKDVTMKEIVDKSGLSKGAFYHYFESKESLFREIVLRFLSMGKVDYEKFDQNSLKLFYSQYVDYLQKSINELILMFSFTAEEKFNVNFFLIMFEAAARFPEFLKMELENYQKDLKSWITVVANAKKSGEIRSKTNNIDIAKLFLYSNDGVFMRFINNDKSGNYGELLRRNYNAIYENLKT
ncbi:MAG: TetR/AcrR family transcriptional regulator [Bacteroidales bacterium]|nr:TetR/AcrR family transcriptional regulator [Bacteroidales bacterium]